MSKIYTSFANKFCLPGANPNQISYISFESIADLLEHIIYLFDANREVIINLDGDEMEESINQIIDELNELISNIDLENRDLKGMCWEAGSFFVEIYCASAWPNALADIKEVIRDLEGDSIDEDCDDSSLGILIKNLDQISVDCSEKDFQILFDEIADKLSEGSVF